MFVRSPAECPLQSRSKPIMPPSNAANMICQAIAQENGWPINHWGCSIFISINNKEQHTPASNPLVTMDDLS